MCGGLNKDKVKISKRGNKIHTICHLTSRENVNIFRHCVYHTFDYIKCFSGLLSLYKIWIRMQGNGKYIR